MFWGIDGYEQKSLAKELVKMRPKYVSLAGECTAMILKDKNNSEGIPRGVGLWKSVLDLSPGPEALIGYGTWTLVTSLDQDQWESLTLLTCKQTGGRLNWAGNVAERISSADTITDAGFNILKLMIQSELAPLDAELVGEHATDALRRTKGSGGIRQSWNALHDAMLDRGFSLDF